VPEVAPTSRTLWADPHVQIDEGFVYVAGRPVVSLAPGERAWAGPGGALLVGAVLVDRGALPGRTPRDLHPSLVPESVRWSDDGRRVAGVGPDGAAVVIDLGSREVVQLGNVEPVAVDAWIDRTGCLVRNGVTVLDGLREASPAVWEDQLAGPGGLVWSLRTGAPVSAERVVALGCTVGTPDGFVTVDWQTHMLRTLPSAGPGAEAPLPLEPDDLVVAGVWADGAVHLSTAYGRNLTWRDGRVEPGDRTVRQPAPASIDTPVGPWRMAGTTAVDGTTFGWTEDGWLLAWPADG
jgi:hypothetical protein